MHKLRLCSAVALKVMPIPDGGRYCVLLRRPDSWVDWESKFGLEEIFKVRKIRQSRSMFGKAHVEAVSLHVNRSRHTFFFRKNILR